MSGHSKWNNIKHKKEKTDAQRGKVFTKVGKEIAMAVKAGGPDPVSYSKLKDLIAKAKSLNVPNVTLTGSSKRHPVPTALLMKRCTTKATVPRGWPLLSVRPPTAATVPQEMSVTISISSVGTWEAPGA